VNGALIVDDAEIMLQTVGHIATPGHADQVAVDVPVMPGEDVFGFWTGHAPRSANRRRAKIAKVSHGRPTRTIGRISGSIAACCERNVPSATPSEARTRPRTPRHRADYGRSDDSVTHSASVCCQASGVGAHLRRHGAPRCTGVANGTRQRPRLTARVGRWSGGGALVEEGRRAPGPRPGELRKDGEQHKVLDASIVDTGGRESTANARQLGTVGRDGHASHEAQFRGFGK